jgi:hypothetical protein
MLDGNLETISLPDSGVDNPEATLAQDVADLVGLFERFPGVHLC